MKTLAPKSEARICLEWVPRCRRFLAYRLHPQQTPGLSGVPWPVQEPQVSGEEFRFYFDCSSPHSGYRGSVARDAWQLGMLIPTISAQRCRR